MKLKKTGFETAPYTLVAKPGRQLAYSPRIGLLNLSRVFRKLRLPGFVQRHLKALVEVGDGEDSALPGPKGLTSVVLARCVEYLVLLQASGADCIDDWHLLADDASLIKGLGYPPPSQRSAQAVMQSLATLASKASKKADVTGIAAVVAHSCERIWNDYIRSYESPRQAPIVINLVRMPENEPPQIAWATPDSEALPCRIVAIWREAGVMLGGALCHDDDEIISLISRSLAAIPESKYGRHIHAGSFCCRPRVLAWLSQQSILIHFELRKVAKQRKEPILISLSEQVSSQTTLSLARQKAGWSKPAVHAGLRVSWKKLGPSSGGEHNPKLKLLRFGIRREPEGRQHSAYAVIVTNRNCEGGRIIAEILEGVAELNRMVGDLDLLAWGGNPGARNGKIAESHFQLAMLTFNLCSVIRQTCLQPANVSMDRFRELIIHCAGTISTSGRYRRLQLCQPDSKENFEKVARVFRLAEKPAAKA